MASSIWSLLWTGPRGKCFHFGCPTRIQIDDCSNHLSAMIERLWRCLKQQTVYLHDVIGEPTFADAILDRVRHCLSDRWRSNGLLHNAYHIGLDGQSMRKTLFKAGDETENN